MKNTTTTTAALVAGLGLSALTFSPAAAAYENCDAAAAAGAYNIPVGDPGYGEHLDSDLDGIGCENATGTPAADPYVAPADPYVAPDEPYVAPVDPADTQVGPPPAQQQVVEVPAGAVDAGVNTGMNVQTAVAQDRPGAGWLLAAGAVAVASTVGGVVLLRRRSAGL